MRRTAPEYLELLKDWEGLETEAYRDSGGVWTIGYGHTGNVHEGDTVTESQAEALLQGDVLRFEQRVNRLVTVPLNDAQFAALVSFDYNTGALHKSTLLKKLNSGEYESVPDELSRWIYVKKTKVRGLVNRRAKEAALFTSLDDEIALGGAGKDQIERAAPPVISKENVSWGAGILGTLGMSFTDAGPVQWAIAGVLIGSFAIAAYMFFKRRGC